MVTGMPLKNDPYLTMSFKSTNLVVSLVFETMISNFP